MTEPSTTNAPAPTPEPTAAPAAPAQAVRKGLTSAELAAKLSGKLEAKRAEPAPVAAPVAVEPKAEQPVAPVEAPKPAGSDATKLSQAISKAAKLESELLSGKKSLETVQRQFAELQAKLEAASKDPVAALKLANYDPIRMAEEMRDGKLRAERLPAQAELPDDVKELLAEAKAAKEQRAKAEQDQQRSALREQNLGFVKSSLAEVAAEFPILAAMPAMPDQLLNVIESTLNPEEVDSAVFRDLCTKAQAHVLGEAKTLLTNSASLKTLLSDEGVKAAVLEALGLAKQPDERTEQPVPTERDVGEPAEPKGKRVMKTLTSKASQVPSRQKGGTSADIAAKIRTQFYNG